MSKQLLSVLKVSTLAIVLSFGLSYALAWTAPTATPPTGNVSAPINTGSTDQTKAGDLCTIKGGTTKCLSATQLAAPSTTFSASPTIIQSGQTTTLTWSVTDASSCTASGSWSGTKVISGSEVSSALYGTGGPISYTFTLSCTGAGGTTSKDVIVQVLAPFSVTYINGTGNWVSIPVAVTTVKFRARGGNGYDSGCCYAANGGGASYAYYGSSIPILAAGGGGGGGVRGYAGGSGGDSGGVIHGNGGTTSASAGGGGAGTNSSGGAGGEGYDSSLGGAGGNSASPNGKNGSGYKPGLGGSRWGGGAANVYGGGGGGGFYGGGGDDTTYGGGGGGRSGYLHTSLTSADGSGFRSLNLSEIGNPASIYLFGGAGTSGYITMTY